MAMQNNSNPNSESIMKHLLSIILITMVVSIFAKAAPVGICLHAYSPDAPVEKIECFEFERAEKMHSGTRFFLANGRTAIITDYRTRGIVHYPQSQLSSPQELAKLLADYETHCSQSPSTRPYLNPWIQKMRSRVDHDNKVSEDMASLPTISLADGTKLEGCRATKRSESTVTVMHSGGVKTINIAELSDAAKKSLNWNEIPIVEPLPTVAKNEDSSTGKSTNAPNEPEKDKRDNDHKFWPPMWKEPITISNYREGDKLRNAQHADNMFLRVYLIGLNFPNEIEGFANKFSNYKLEGEKISFESRLISIAKIGAQDAAYGSTNKRLLALENSEDQERIVGLSRLEILEKYFGSKESWEKKHGFTAESMQVEQDQEVQYVGMLVGDFWLRFDDYLESVRGKNSRPHTGINAPHLKLGAKFWKFQFGESYQTSINTLKSLKDSGYFPYLQPKSGSERVANSDKSLFAYGGETTLDGILTDPCRSITLIFVEDQLSAIRIASGFKTSRNFVSNQIADMKKIVPGATVKYVDSKDDVGNVTRNISLESNNLRIEISDEIESDSAPSIWIHRYQ